MEKLSIRKQLNIIRLYFSGLSYREIAAKAGVSVGAVTNVTADLKAGNYPEVGDVSERVDLLKELAAEVRKSRLTVGEAVTGITIVNSVKELGLEPGDIPQYVSLCKTLTPGGIETQAFVKAAMEYRDVLERTSLSVDEMEKKVRSLEETANQLEPTAKKALDLCPAFSTIKHTLAYHATIQANVCRQVSSTLGGEADIRRHISVYSDVYIAFPDV
jgi:AcrR family transcriptional regulator